MYVSHFLSHFVSYMCYMYQILWVNSPVCMYIKKKIVHTTGQIKYLVSCIFDTGCCLTPAIYCSFVSQNVVAFGLLS